MRRQETIFLEKFQENGKSFKVAGICLWNPWIFSASKSNNINIEISFYFSFGNSTLQHFASFSSSFVQAIQNQTETSFAFVFLIITSSDTPIKINKSTQIEHYNIKF